MRYDINNWYWVVANSATHVYSSAAGDYVPVANSGYQNWLSDGGIPTQIDTEENLGAVLERATVKPAPSAMQDAYKDRLADNLPLKLLVKVLLNHENRLRAVEGSGSVNPQQFKNALKNLL